MKYILHFLVVVFMFLGIVSTATSVYYWRYVSVNALIVEIFPYMQPIERMFIFTFFLLGLFLLSPNFTTKIFYFKKERKVK